MKKRIYTMFKYLGFAGLLLPMGIVAMDKDMPMDDIFRYGTCLQEEDELTMDDLLSEPMVLDNSGNKTEPGLFEGFSYENTDFSEDFGGQGSHHGYASASCHSHSSSTLDGNLVSPSSNIALASALVVQQHMQKPEQPAPAEPSNASVQESSSMDESEDDEGPSMKAGQAASESAKKHELHGQKAKDLTKKWGRSAIDKKNGVWTCKASGCGQKIKGGINNLQDHVRQHTGEVYKCACGKESTDRSNFSKHKKKCKDFGKSAADLVKEWGKKRSVQDQQNKVWRCLAHGCGKQIKGSRPDFKKHVRQHTGEVDRCECGKGFTDPSNLRQHKKTCKKRSSSSSSSGSSSSSSGSSDSDDTSMSDESDDQEEATSWSVNKHAGKKHARDEDEDYKEPSFVKKARAKK